MVACSFTRTPTPQSGVHNAQQDTIEQGREVPRNRGLISSCMSAMVAFGGEIAMEALRSC